MGIQMNVNMAALKVFCAQSSIRGLLQNGLRPACLGLQTRSHFKQVGQQPEVLEWTPVMDHAVASVFLWDIWKGLGIAVARVMSEPATINYPFEKGPLSPRFRGEHALRRYPSGE